MSMTSLVGEANAHPDPGVLRVDADVGQNLTLKRSADVDPGDPADAVDPAGERADAGVAGISGAGDDDLMTVRPTIARRSPLPSKRGSSVKLTIAPGVPIPPRSKTTRSKPGCSPSRTRVADNRAPSDAAIETGSVPVGTGTALSPPLQPASRTATDEVARSATANLTRARPSSSVA